MIAQIKTLFWKQNDETIDHRRWFASVLVLIGACFSPSICASAESTPPVQNKVHTGNFIHTTLHTEKFAYWKRYAVW